MEIIAIDSQLKYWVWHFPPPQKKILCCCQEENGWEQIWLFANHRALLLAMPTYSVHKLSPKNLAIDEFGILGKEWGGRRVRWEGGSLARAIGTVQVWRGSCAVHRVQYMNI